MLTPNDIVLHLQNVLPRFTDRFHDELPVTSGSVSGGIFTIVFPEPHGLQPGYQINITDVIIRNRIINVIQNSDDTVSYITENVHDKTAYVSEGHKNTWPAGLTSEIELPSGNITVNLLNDPSAVPNDKEITCVEGSPVFPLTGEEYLLENRAYGVGGVKTVDTVTDENTITIDLSNVPDVPDGEVIMSFVITNPRIAAAVDLERAQEIYTSQGSKNEWLFIIMLDRRPSKDRQNDDDLTSLPNSTLRLMNIMQDFSTLLVSDSSGQLSAEEAKQWAYSDLFIILNKCLYGWEGVGYNGDGQINYNTSYYSHAYEWQARQRVDWEDGYINNETTALRKINFTQTIFDQGESSGEIEYP